MTLAVSIAALVLSILSLTWQAWTWRNNGPVLRVEVNNSFTDALIPGEPEHYVCVQVINTGRAAASVTGWGVEMPGGGNLVVLQPPYFSTKIPVRLEPHARADFYVGADELRQRAAERGVALKRMKPWAQSATGKKVYSKRPVPLR